ncbi:hypothetical protein D3C71_1367230 [compost metagenome]
MGDLPVAVNPTISQNTDRNEIEFSWDIPADLPYQYDNDRAMLMIYFPALKVSCYHLIGSKRTEGKDTIRIDAAHIGERMEAYISFVKDNGKQVSNSVYAGSLNAGKEVIIPVQTAPKTETLTDQNQDSISLPAIMPFLFEKAKVNKVVKTFDAKDKASITLLKNLVFKEEGYFIEKARIAGQWINEYQFAMLKAEWDLLK